jgi:protein TonB
VGTALARYIESVRQRVLKHRQYPHAARRANVQGTVCLRIVIASSGQVHRVQPTCGASHQPLLRAALASVSAASPFAPLPASLGGQLAIDVPVVFELEP